MKVTANNKLLQVLDKLRDAGVYTSLRQDRQDAVSVDAAVPGQRWEIDVLSDGSVEVEVFQSDGSILGEDALDDLLRRQGEMHRNDAA